MKKQGLYFIILAVMAAVAFSGCEGLAELIHGPKPDPTYTVTFNANGGNGTAPAAMTADAGSSITLPGASGLTRSGYTFGGWNTSSAGTGTNYGTGASYTVSGDVTLYARWTAVATTPQYTVTFNANGGSGTVPAAQSQSSGASITLPSGSGLSRSGYTFGGWNTNAAGTGNNYSGGSAYTVSGNVILYARWIAGTTTFTVTYNVNGGSGTAPSAQTASSGSSITLPGGSGLTRTGYTFGGWNTDASGAGTNYTAGSSYTVSGNVTLYARWIAAGTTYTVTFNANSGSGTASAAQTASSGSSITLPGGSGLTRTGYTFGGWNTNAAGTGINYPAGSSYTVSGNITLYAKWDIATYTVTFNVNSGSGTVPAALTASSGSSITLPNGDGLSRTNYTFGGWNTNTSGTGTNYSAGSSYTSNVSITLYAKWDPITDVPGATLAAKLSWLQTNALSNVDYTVEVTADESISPRTLSYSGKTNIGITLKGTDAVRTISLSSNGALFTVESGVTLVLDNNITLQGHSDNTDSVVKVNPGGTLVMNAGAAVTGNITDIQGGGVYVSGNGTFTMEGGKISDNTSYNGGGVYVSDSYVYIGGTGQYVGGTFTMSGGEISGNIGYYDGGGVYVNNGTFTMEGGTISGNTSFSYAGGGVYVNGNGTFTMKGGTISGNTAASDGGGVYSGGTFTMEGGDISDNTSSYRGGGVYADGNSFTMRDGTISGNTVSNSGGGVYAENITFTMNGGTISGNTASSSNGGGVSVNASGIRSATFTMTGGTISGNTARDNGGGVSVSTSGTRPAVFTKTGGTIYGYSAGDTINSNVVKNSSGTVQSGRGHAVYVSSNKWRETTAGPSFNMNSSASGAAGGWEFGLQADGSYTLDPKGFAVWYGATRNENTISFYSTHGGVYYNYPTDDGFDIKNYESLVITYASCVINDVGTDEKGDVGARITVKVINATLGSGYYGTDIVYYPSALSDSGGTLTIDDSILNENKSWATDVHGSNGTLGFAIAQDGNASSDMFTITFTSITFMPGD